MPNKFTKYVTKFGLKFPMAEIIDGVECPYDCELPKKKSDIINIDIKNPLKQKWKRPEIMEFFSLENIAKGVAKYNDNWWFHKEENLTPDALEYIDDQWAKRTDGVWISIKGDLYWITGEYWFYLCHYKLPIRRYPDYRDKDRRFFIKWNYIERSSSWLGMTHLKGRREGLTAKACSILLNYATSHKKARCGIQSKSETDAKIAFRDYIRGPFMELAPFFMCPFQKSTSTEKELILSPPALKATRGANVFAALWEDDLSSATGSTITYRATVENAYDSQRLDRYFCDEFIKWPDTNIQNTWNVVKWGLADPTSFGEENRTGKAIFGSTTPAEDDGADDGAAMARGMERGKKFFESCEKEKIVAELGTTTTGLLANFFSSLDGMVYPGKSPFIDEWGFSMEREAEDFLNLQIKACLSSGDAAGAISIRRQQPRTREEAFTEGTTTTLFDLEKIENCILRQEGADFDGTPRVEKFWKSYRLIWDVFPHSVRLVPDKSGKWLLNNLLFTQYASENSPRMKFNNVTMDGLMPVPNNSLPIDLGCDPFELDKDQTTSDDLSLGGVLAWIGYRKEIDGDEPELQYKEANPNWSEKGVSALFLACYKFRPDTLELFAEEVMKLCVLLGRPIMIERNKTGLIREMTNRGFGRFISYNHGTLTESQKVHNSVRGTFTTESTNQAGGAWMAKIYVDHCHPHKMPPPLLKEGKKFDMSKIGKFDLHSAAFQCGVEENQRINRDFNKRQVEAVRATRSKVYTKIYWRGQKH